MNDLPDTIERLSTRLEALERRIHVLEHPAAASDAVTELEAYASPRTQAGDGVSFVASGGAFSVLGKAMLGIAGAYLLRAIAESSSLPRLAIAAIAIAYAITWLVWAARQNAGAWFASTTYACTSALILAPMLWELTLRFNVLPVPVTAGILGAFVCAASALAWKRNVAPIVWVSNLAAAAVALALAVASHQMAPFIAVLLLMVLLCELAAARNRELGVRTLVALAADLGVWGLIYIYSSPATTRAEYPILGNAALLAPGFTLFLIFAGSVAFKTLVQREKITVFETVQVMIAFVLAACALLYFGPPAGAVILGIVCITLAAASYAAVFVFFDKDPERRNDRVFASWSAALLVAGSLLCLPPMGQAAVLGVAAIVATVLGARRNRLSLEFHGTVYLVAATSVSGLPSYVFLALAGTLAGAPSWSICLVSLCAALCYAAARPCQEERWSAQILHLVSASLAIGAVAALLVQGMVSSMALEMIPGAHHVAFVRTLILCLVALAAAFSGAHWRRTELTRIGYVTLVLIAAKLVFEDLRLGHLEFIAASIFLVAITLIAVPRIAHMGQRA
jgi:hypothetical protein